MSTDITYPLYIGKFILYLGYATGPWAQVGKYLSLDALNEAYRAMRPTVDIVGAKVLREDGSVHHVIF